MIQIKVFVFNPFSENTFVVYDESLEAIVIDPGCYESSEKEELVSFISGENLRVIKLINTHSHIDHCLGNQFIKELYKVKLELHEKEVPVLASVVSYASEYGFPGYQHSSPDTYLSEGDTITFGNSTLEIVFVPGHSPGHIALINKDENICIGGDVLFQGSIGRTDLPGGDFDTLIESIKNKIFTLEDHMVVYPGHGAATTVGEEKLSNPFVGQTILS